MPRKWSSIKRVDVTFHSARLTHGTIDFPHHYERWAPPPPWRWHKLPTGTSQVAQREGPLADDVLRLQPSAENGGPFVKLCVFRDLCPTSTFFFNQPQRLYQKHTPSQTPRRACWLSSSARRCTSAVCFRHSSCRWLVGPPAVVGGLVKRGYCRRLLGQAGGAHKAKKRKRDAHSHSHQKPTLEDNLVELLEAFGGTAFYGNNPGKLGKSNNSCTPQRLYLFAPSDASQDCMRCSLLVSSVVWKLTELCWLPVNKQPVGIESHSCCAWSSQKRPKRHSQVTCQQKQSGDLVGKCSLEGQPWLHCRDGSNCRPQ